MKSVMEFHDFAFPLNSSLILHNSSISYTWLNCFYFVLLLFVWTCKILFYHEHMSLFFLIFVFLWTLDSGYRCNLQAIQTEAIPDRGWLWRVCIEFHFISMQRLCRNRLEMRGQDERPRIIVFVRFCFEFFVFVRFCLFSHKFCYISFHFMMISLILCHCLQDHLLRMPVVGQGLHLSEWCEDEISAVQLLDLLLRSHEWPQFFSKCGSSKTSLAYASDLLMVSWSKYFSFRVSFFHNL
jgi:hypothetical protein